MPKRKISKLKAAMRHKQPARTELTPVKPEDLLSSGCAVLDVNVSGRAAGGIYAKGLFTFIVGDTSTGKTWLLFSALAEAARNGNFDGYKFVYDPPERGGRMDIRKFFGATVDERVEGPPRGVSRTVEDFYFNLEQCCKAGPCIYLLDSMDALNAEADVEKFDDASKKHAEGKKQETGTYGMAKAKQNSINMRMVPAWLTEHGSILIVISQTRQAVGNFFAEKSRSGGKSLDFYCDVEIWTSVKKTVKKEVMGKPRVVATTVAVRVKKNRVNGWVGDTEFTFLKNYGIDNTGSGIDYMLEEGGWKKANGVINATDFKVKMKREALIEYVEERGLHKKLALAVKRVYKEIEAKTTPKRSPRYE